MKGLALVWDGALSLLSCVASLAVGGIPAWYAHRALGAGLGPDWIYVPVLLLAFVTFLVALDFFKKAAQGIAPARERRR